MTNSKIPTKVFDMEYGTQVRREYEFLLEKGIKPVFVKTNPTYGVKTYKYAKTAALFNALVEYFSAGDAE